MQSLLLDAVLDPYTNIRYIASLDSQRLTAQQVLFKIPVIE
jgi:hypothetical protein